MKTRKQMLLNSTICFLFPLHPIKVAKSINFIVILSVLLALRFALGFATIYLPVVGFSFSVAWMPLIAIGWIFGPIYGLFFGAITDTISFFIKPTSLWFWLYAIQEPMVGFISGCFASIYLIRIKTFQYKTDKNIGITNQFYVFDKKDKKINKKFLIEFLIQQIIIIGFSIIAIITLLKWLDISSFEGKSQYDQNFFHIGKYVVLAIIILFFIVIEFLIIFMLKRCDTSKIILCFWIINLVFVISVLFSFILGTITAPLYYEYANNGLKSPSFLKYGYAFYLIPRVIKESIKAPIEIVLLLCLLPICDIYINNAKKTTLLKWENNK